ncbi:hypothetical protein HPY09_20000 (plasmid) [Vibrio cholerae]|uniref:hypothetical protein n=1 Tax=Vibrio cholerae TaxID=666 RepID=UPI001582A180|nr:hypothetical protein [Vibrio cholerae]QKU73225.1 hypothetical protein HPY09_20000 [Vibrio cholerae]QKU77215.1 hypothetical protein HPY05_20195 [Vibrio cholerae]
MQTSQYAGFVDDKSEWGTSELRSANHEGSGHFRVKALTLTRQFRIKFSMV